MNDEPDAPNSPPRGVSEADSAGPDCPVIDAHVHVLPAKLLEAIRHWFAENTTWTIPALSPETVVAQMTERTDRFVFFPYAHRPGVSTALNEFAAEWQSNADAAIGLGTVHAGDADPERVVIDLFERGLHGVKIHCPVQGFSADDPRLDPVYELLADREAPLVIHASTHPFYRGESNLGAGPIRGLLKRYPSLRVCVPHLRLFETEAFLDLVDQFDVYLDTAVALGAKTHERIDLRDGDLPLDRLATYGDRVMFGSDYPIRPHPYDEAFRDIETLFPDRRDDVFHENARRFFDLS